MSAGAGTQPANILLVEDSPTQALQLRLVLEGNGFNVSWASTAEAALDSLNGGLPDLVIADFHLPGMNGDELTRQMRLNVRTRAIPVIMLTEARESAVERQGLESGADAYIAKSAEQALIILRIKALLRRRYSPAAEPKDGREAPSFSAFRRACILVVDDSPGQRAHLQQLLSHEGYAVTSAADPTEALRLIGSHDTAWDCVLVNLLSLSFDGTDLCRQLNAYRGLAPLPGMEVANFSIVGLGNEDGGDTLARTFEAGADDIIPWSADADAMRIRIRSLIRRKLLQDENWRIEAELQERELAFERARAEAASAEALATANRELAEANLRLKETQSKLVQAAKMASLGELVAGIAHEINNPLAFILAHQGTVERLLTEVAAKLPRTLTWSARSRNPSSGWEP